ncbi:hypothetical protein CFO_g826 [Ceratocystis platani]|uniref:RRM domain-containing protein n=1 Tax=Ceratocystis fimbriata f. sp. platani TaxID=88771 RepID=A0A0F8BWD7_CERFI|nr:hypothetical protein CFO_g826 [Ceratocystis platani]
MTAAQTKAVRPGSLTAGATGTNANLPSSKSSGRNGRSRNQALGVMVKIRLLPPAMQEAECLKLLPEEWHVGKGKVDSFRYTPGKVSNRPGRPSHASVAYFQLSREDDVVSFGEAVKLIVWEDAGDTFHDSCLKAKPYLERCVYRKNPMEKDRGDSLQGTIDQDPEFIHFLENLTRVAANEKEEDKTAAQTPEVEKSTEKPTSTPLVEYMREKREKDKDAGGAGRGSRSAKQEARLAAKSSKSSDKKKARDKDRDSGKDKEKSERMTDKIKILKKAATADAPGTSKNAAAASNGSQAPGSQSSSKTKRATIAAAARVLQRDHGLSPGAAHRRARAEIAKVEMENKTAAAAAATTSGASTSKKDSPKEPSQTPTETSKPAEPAAGSSRREPGRTRGRGRGKGGGDTNAAKAQQQEPVKPIILLKKKPEIDASPASIQSPSLKTNEAPRIAEASTKGASEPATQPSASSSKGKLAEKSNNNSKARKADRQDAKSGASAPLTVTPGATKAFIKNVNPSCGINASSLRTALSCFGAINAIDIELRKGFAYVEFSQHESLVAAVKAGSISIGQGQIRVAERKVKKPAPGPAASIAQGSSGSPSGNGSLEKTDEKDAEKAKTGDSKATGEKAEKAEKPEKSEKGSSRRNRGRRGGSGKKEKDGGRGVKEASTGGDKGVKGSGPGAAALAPGPASALAST